MSQSKLTLIGLYNHLKGDLFSKMLLPAGINKDIVIDNILLRGGEFEVLISNPLVLKDAIGVWSYKYNWTFDRWLKAINTKYNPLENYNRTETWTDLEESHNAGITNNTNNGTTKDKSKGTGEVENTKSAFNSSNYEPNDKSNSKNETDAETTVESTSTGTNTDDFTKSVNHTANISGNIGVTTSQQMLQSELDVAMFNLYDRIADLFLQEFIIPIY